MATSVDDAKFHAKDYDYLIRMMLIGDSGVGKTCLLTRFNDNVFNDEYTSTIGVDFGIQTLIINNKKIKLQIWDTAGQERFANITVTYYKGARCVMLVFDMTAGKDNYNEDCIVKWLNTIRENCPTNDVSIIIAVNKCDLFDSNSMSNSNEKRNVTFDRTQELLQEWIKVNDWKGKYGVFDTSAKTGFNVKEAFETLATMAVSIELSVFI